MSAFSRIAIFLAAVFGIFSATFAQRWEQVVLPSPYSNNYWLDVYFLPSNPQLGWICGMRGMVLRTFNGGDTWTGTTITGIDTLESVHFPTPLVGYVSGPNGIFRTSDGGASWRSIRPDSARELWGCYFASADTGVVIGGGCLGEQRFFRTTDGGATWNFTAQNVRSSGLTDPVLLSSAGRGYAASSGLIWLTNDGGKTWDTLTSTGERYWQEEICVMRSTFLLPVAGTTCGGVGTGGGMRFSRNNGNSWTEYQTGDFMFGAFLLNDSTGWACGVKRNIWHTNNYGASWELRNCGVGAVDFDDIWMINETTGWAVGTGVYRLVSPYRSITRTSFDFGETCYPGSRFDTLFVKSTSFSATDGTLSLTGDNPSDFSIIEPASLNFRILPCDSMRVVVRFTPSATADFTANLAITASQPFAEFVVPLAGRGKRAVSQVADTILDMGNRPCGRFSYDSIGFVNPSAEPEAITWIDHVSVRDEIRPTGGVPLTIPGGRDARVVFRTFFTDTGTVTNLYRFWIGACPSLLWVKATGYSPIITAPFSRAIGLACQPVQLDTLTISNTGNAPLVFSEVRISGQNAADFSIVGWADGVPLLRTIPPKQAAGIVVRFAPATSGQKKMQLVLKNNDSTTVRGDRSTLLVQYVGGQTGSAVKLISADSLNGGLLCPGGQSSQRIVLRNIGGSPAYLTQISPLKQGLRLSLAGAQLPRTISNDDSLVIVAFFAPHAPGKLLDTLKLRFEPCGEIVQVILACEAITTRLTALPDSLTGVIQAGAPVRRTITVRSSGTDAAIISSITLSPTRTDWRLTDVPDLPLTLAAGSDTTITLEFTAQQETVFSGNICITAEELCGANVCVPVNVRTIETKLVVSASELTFPDNRCANPLRTHTLTITNSGSLPDTLTQADITAGAPQFAVVSPVVPFVLPAGGSVGVAVECRQQNEGAITGTLTLRSAKTQPASFVIPLRAFFATARLALDRSGVFFGEVEQCDAARIIRVRASNSGSLPETLSIARTGAVAVFGISPRDETVVPPGGTVEIDVILTPGIASQTGLFTETFRLTGRTCGQEFLIPAAVNIIRPVLTIQPDSLHFGTLITGDETVRTVLVSNRGERPVTLETVTLQFGTSGFTIIGLPPLPRALRPGETDSIVTLFKARQAGASADVLVISGGSICSETEEIPLTAETDNRIYPARAYIDRYDVTPGDSISVALRLDGDISEAVVRSIAVRISYDSELFYLSGITADSAGKQVNIPYFTDSASVVFVLNDAPSAPIGRPGTVAVLSGLSLFSLPDTCTLGIKAFTPQARRITQITTQNGFLRVRPACGPLADVVPMPVVSAMMLNSGAGNGDNITLRLWANVPANAAIAVKNLFGATVFAAGNVEVGDRTQDYSINTAQFPAGTYFIEITSSGITERHNAVIFR